MNSEDMIHWQNAVREHRTMIDSLANDSIEIKELMKKHLKKFFDFDDIKFEDNFRKIVLKWEYSRDPVINPNDLTGLDMIFIISHRYDDNYGDGIVIELYPFGFD